MACTQCSTCTCNDCVTINWATTPIAYTLNPCVIPEPCDDGCVDTIKSDCVLLSENIACELDLYIIAGATLTNTLKYLYCAQLFTFEAGTIIGAYSNVNGGNSGAIVLNVTPSEFTIKLYKDGVLIQTINDPTSTFSSVAAGDYVVVLNGTIAINVTVPDLGLN